MAGFRSSAEVTSEAGQCSTCGYDATLGLWTIGHLALNARATLNIKVRVTGSGSITNTAAIIDNHYFTVGAGFNLTLSIGGSQDIVDDFAVEMTLIDPNGNELETSTPLTRYVAPGGSDAGNDCTNPGSPCATRQPGQRRRYP